MEWPLPKTFQEEVEASGPKEYVVEKILNKHKVGGKVKYFLKWKGRGREENTWVPEELLSGSSLLPEFERKWEINEAKKTAINSSVSGGANAQSLENHVVSQEDGKKDKAGASASAAKKAKTGKDPGQSPAFEVTGFDRGLQPEKIIGVTDSTGELMFLMKWKDTDEEDLVPASQANVKCAQIVISYYESIFQWATGNDD